ASVLVSVRSLIATISISLVPCIKAARKTWRPIRPKPLIPTRIAIALLSSLSVARCGRPTKGHVTHDPRTAGNERGRAGVQRGGRRHDIVHEDDVLVRETSPDGVAHAKRAGNVRQSLFRCQPRLRFRRAVAFDCVAP